MRMHTKANHFKIGVFVIIASGLLVVAIVMLAKPSMEEPMYIETYMDESVAGLNVGSPITYRGVDIGRVEEIAFVSSRYESSVELGRYVVIDMVIESALLLGSSDDDAVSHLDKLVANGLRIRLTTNPLTGLAYLEADYPLAPGELLELEDWKPKYYHLPSDKSVFNKFSQSALTAFEKLDQIDFVGLMDRLDKLLVTIDEAILDANVEEVTVMMKGLLSEIQQTSERMKALMSPEYDSEPEVTLADMLVRMDNVLKRFDTLATSQAPDITIIIDDLREFSVNIRELTEDIKENPSKLFSKPVKSEVVK
jgi:phospholipid/cholesterol/gamma-HCH transport system substrate-binding protein/paraquat-inducible protein B